MGQSPPSETYNDQRNGFPFFQGVTDFGDINHKSRIWCSADRSVTHVGKLYCHLCTEVQQLRG
ncbi:MAG: hypothetical protein WBF33_38865 [Candidatus Nitrosopolaris sp.]